MKRFDLFILVIIPERMPNGKICESMGKIASYIEIDSEIE